jgi:capsid protein
LFKEWRVTQLRSVAGGTRAGFSSLAKTYEGSYSSQRQELMEQFVIYRMIRECFVSAYVDTIYRDFVLMAVASGLVDVSGADMETLFDAEHVGAGAPYIEPQREVNADEKKVQAGFNARHQIILQRGGNPIETQALIEVERAQDEAAGLTFSSTVPPEPTATEDEGASAEPDADDDTTEDEDETLEGTENQSRYTIGRRYENSETGEVFIYTEHGFIKETETANVI